MVGFSLYTPNCPNAIINTDVTLPPDKFGKPVKLQSYVQKVRGSDLTRGTGYAG
jgi:hypothetical protein